MELTSGSAMRPVLQVIVASTREGRQGEPVATWFVEQATTHGAFAVELIDLARVNLPMLDERNHPRLRNYQHEHTKAWSAMVGRIADDAPIAVVATAARHGPDAYLRSAAEGGTPGASRHSTPTTEQP